MPPAGGRGAFVPVNCAALPESLIEAELFGYADGAFTGARRGGAIGLVKEADGGTLFLDEIGDMPVALQAVLLRLLDDWTVRPVGGVRAKVDVFLVSATNASLDKAIAERALPLRPALSSQYPGGDAAQLRDRSDFEAIVHHLLGAIDPNCEITPADIAHLAARPWPGNIRELRNMLARFTLAARRLIDEASAESIDQQPADDIRIAPRHPARPNPCGVCRNRRKHQRNCATSRCLKKHHLSRTGAEKTRVMP